LFSGNILNVKEKFEDTKRGNLKLYIAEGQTKQWPKGKSSKFKQRSTSN